MSRIETDVLVCGGGVAGCAAALAARRAGASVLLVEAQGQLGGMGTSGLVSHWLGGRTPEGRWVTGGIFKEFSEGAAAEGIALLPRTNPQDKYQPHGWFDSLAHGVPFDPFAMAAFLDRKMAEARVEVLLLTQAVGVTVGEAGILDVTLANKGGLSRANAAAVVDATGDADLATYAGCTTQLGREEDHLMTPATLMFHVDNVDQDALAHHVTANDQPRFRTLIEALREKGEWHFPTEIFISVQLQEKGTMMINTSRLCGVDGTDPWSISDGLRRGRAETQELLALMRQHFPGFAKARLKAVAPLLGVRETRRILGDFTLTVDDVRAGRRFPDTIGLSSYGWDLPDPKRPSFQPLNERKLPAPPFTHIPYRIMLPRGAGNLICPGRAVSVEREVLGPLRVMAPCMAMGQAAGLAATQVVSKRIPFSSICLETLMAALRAQDAILEIPSSGLPPLAHKHG